MKKKAAVMRKQISFAALGLGFLLTTIWVAALAWFPLQLLGSALLKAL
jgi:hypothetical protein